MKKIINLILVLMIFALTACSNTNGDYYLIKDYSTIGIIQNYDKNDENDRLKEKMLKKQLPKMKKVGKHMCWHFIVDIIVTVKK